MLSVLIITYNREHDLLALLEDLKHQSKWIESGDEILVYNNNSTYEYKKVKKFITENQALPINYMEGSENLGVAKGRNLLIKMAKNDNLLVIDDDIEFKQNTALQYVKKLCIGQFYSEENTAVVTFAIRFFENNEVQLAAFPHKDFDKYLKKEHFQTYFFVGATHLMKKEIFEKTGYYPEDYFYGMEEYDLSFRILDAGYNIAYDAAVTVLHKDSPFGRVPNAEKVAMLWLNKSKVAYKYLPRIYFYSTAVIWSCYFLLKSKIKLKLFFKTWLQILKIPRTTLRKTVSNQTMLRLHELDARLLY